MKNFKCLLVSPASVFDPADPFTTGVVFMPIGLAYGAAALKKIDVQVEVLDLFGESPKEARRIGDYIRLGLPDESLIEQVADIKPDLIIFYANQLLNHASLVESVKSLRMHFPAVIVGIAENTQAVTAYLLKEVQSEFFEIGADFLISGEMENILEDIIERVVTGISLDEWDLDGVSTKNTIGVRSAKIVELDLLDFPAWELFPLHSYWDLGYAHGPFESSRYLPILTSRGCPFPCKFCVVPATNNRKWRFRSAINVVDEISYLNSQFGVNEFHLEDLNPTIQDSRMREIANEILKRELRITWKIVAGTKIESIKSVDTLRIMRDSGLNYLSMSPESGSKKLLKEIGKPFDVAHAITMTKASYGLGIKTQACFVLGYPSESFIDRLKSLTLSIRLTLSGLDELVVFIMSPVPGSEVYRSYLGQFQSLSSLSFSPRWRKDFSSLLLWRLLIYISFLSLKFVRNPIRMFFQLRNLITGRYQTKMEMTPVRGIKYIRIARQTKVND
jgi:radical SAM superfamily enzyme YgiQ (UPF0313 family)